MIREQARRCWSEDQRVSQQLIAGSGRLKGGGEGQKETVKTRSKNGKLLIFGFCRDSTEELRKWSGFFEVSYYYFKEMGLSGQSGIKTKIQKKILKG